MYLGREGAGLEALGSGWIEIISKEGDHKILGARNSELGARNLERLGAPKLRISKLARKGTIKSQISDRRSGDLGTGPSISIVSEVDAK